MLLLGFAFCYLAMTALSLAMSRHHKVLFQGPLPEARVRLLRVVAMFAFAIGLALAVSDQGGEIGTILWLCQVMLAALLVVALLAWHSRWVLPLVALLPLGGGVMALL
ncbi:DUF3325 domain-containing protein [Pseudomonas solani]|uniref:DUF3325 domain-containing protein n=1 Tax=Pseudomonas solani TaxID=2731552 RepID=UPI003C30E3A6